MKISLLPWPNGHRCAFAIRDDDISYYTHPSMLERLYRDAWKMGFKISLAVIPRIATDIIPGRYVAARGLRYTPMVPPDVRGTGEKRVITDNSKLVKYLISKTQMSKFELLLHGFEHRRVKGEPEFSAKGNTRTRRWLEEADGIFEGAFGWKPKVFVPPWELLSPESRDLLREMGYHICRRYPRFLDEYLKSLSKGYYPIPFKRRPVILLKDLGANCVSFRPGIFDLRDNGYFFSMLYDAESSRKASREIFLRNYENWNASIWCNHYWEFFFDWKEEISKTQIFKNFTEFLQYVSDFNIWKCGLEELAEWLRRHNALMIRAKEDTLEIESTEPISNLAVSSDRRPKVRKGDVQLVEVESGIYSIPELPPKERVKLSTYT